MARIFIDGFESGHLGLWDLVNGPSVTSSSPISGIYTLDVNVSFTYSIYKTFNPSKSELYFAFKYKTSTIGSENAGVIGFRDSAGAVSLCLSLEQTTGLIKVTRGAIGGTLLGKSTTSLMTWTAYLIELRYKPLNSGGIVQLKINGGALEVDYSGDTTNGLENISMIGFGRGADGNATSAYCFIDDLVVDDANWIGNTKIQALVPTGAGATSQHNAILSAHTYIGRGNAYNPTGPYVNLRAIIAGTYITRSGSRIKLGFYPYSAYNSSIVECSIGPRDGATTTFSSAPTKITVGGSNSFVIPQGTAVYYSDWITFNLVANTDYLVHFYLSGSSCHFGKGAVTESTYYEANADANDTESLSISGYSTFNTTDMRAFVVEVYVENSEHTYNYEAVSEKPASDFEYIKTSSGQTDTYAMGNLAGSIASIKSVAVQSRNWREGNGTYDRGQHIVRPASTDRLAASKTSIFPIAATSFQSIWELNPEDSAAWEEADINGMEAGIKAVEA